MTTPLRFCMLTTFYPPWSFGGDAIQVQRLSEALAGRGHHVTVLHAPDAYRTLARAEPAAAPSGNGVRVVPIDPSLGPVSPLATYLTGRPLFTAGRISNVLSEGFDVLHFHNPSLLGGPGLLRMGEGVKLYTLHEQWLVCPTHVLWKYRRRVCEKPDCVRCTLTYRRPPQPWRYTGLLDRSVAALDALIAPSDTTAELHRRFADKVAIERLDHFLPDPGHGSTPAESDPYFLYAGRLESIKGVDALLTAFAGESGPSLVVAGTGSLEGRLRRQARDLPRVRFLGWLDQERLDPLFRGALAVVLPTRGHESLPLVLLEAFSRGVPAIVRRFGAQGEIVESSGGGLMYSSDGELDEALRRLAADDELRRELGRKGRVTYERDWTVDAHLGRYLDLVARLGEAKGRAR